MITEDYVSFETAKLLKEKGFDIQGYASLEVFGGNTYKVNGEWITPKEDTIIPTLQMVMKWLREEKDIIIEPHHLYRKEWYALVSSENPLGISVKTTDSYSSYEEACEAAIKYCLENLI